MAVEVTASEVVVLGAGPAGLMAAYELTQQGIRSTVLEKSHIVGGIARTEVHNGFHFDMGGHRFFTKSAEVRRKWDEILCDDFLRRPRLSRIYYDSNFFQYPLRPGNALSGLGLIESSRIVLSYLRWRLFPYEREDSFEQWVTNRFGRRLFEIFFKAYTEKVWGIPCSELSAEWAAQRIKDMSLKTAILGMFVKPGTRVTSLIEEFDYPRHGPGMMWKAAMARVEESGSEVLLNSDAVEIRRRGNRICSVVALRDGVRETITGEHFISSIPVTEFIAKLQPPPPDDVLEAARSLRYRDFLTVCLIVDQPDLFPDNWIYVHDPDVKVGRIQNFKNWSSEMVPDPSKTSLGLEYFCSEGDALWTMTDADLIELGKREIEKLGLAQAADVIDGCVFRVPKSYPIYEGAYREHLAVIKEYVNELVNFQTIGRNGLHRYNNQDHAMLTGMLAARNLVHGEQNDLWNVNTEQTYHEEVHEERDAVTEAVRAALIRAFRKIDPVALGLALGSLAGGIICIATLALVLKGGEAVGPRLSLLGQYFPGYEVTPLGSLIGLAYGQVTGFVGGWSFAFLRNAAVLLSVGSVKRRAERDLFQKLLMSI